MDRGMYENRAGPFGRPTGGQIIARLSRAIKEEKKKKRERKRGMDGVVVSTAVNVYTPSI